MIRKTPRMLVRSVIAATAAATAFVAIPAAAVSVHSYAAAASSSTSAALPMAGPHAVIQPTLAQHLLSLAPTDLARVMVQPVGSNVEARDAISDAGLLPGVRLDRIGITVATGTPAQIRALALDARVKRLDWADEQRAYLGDTSHKATRAEAVHAGAFDIDSDGTLDGLTGTGFSVAVVDSGTDGTHPMLQGDDGSRVKKNLKMLCHDLVGDISGYATVDQCAADATAVNDTDTGSAGGHGTHVTGIAAGSIVTDAAGRQLRGAAPTAEVVAISTGYSLSIMSGTLAMYWVLEHHADPCGDGSCAPIVAVNNSWGPLGGGPFDAESPDTLVQRELVADGVTVVWAAGNDGGDGTENVTNPPGADPTPGVLSVANYDDGGVGSRDNDLDASSSRGENGDLATYPDISAPGHLITSACRPYLTVCASGFDTADPNYNTISGTSMAAPHIAGYVAVLQEAAVRATGSRLTPAEVENLLVNTAHQFGSRTYESDTRNPASTSGTSFDAGHGLVDLTAAVASLTGQTAPPPTDPVCPTDARFTDPAGDATGAFGTETPLPNAAGLDVVASWLSTDATTGDVTFHIEVDDLAESPGGPEGTGEYFDYNFTFGGGGYYLGASRTAEEGETFVLGRFETTRTTLATGLPGSFDPEADRIDVTLPVATWEAEGLPGDLAAGQQVAGLNIVARRSLVLFVPDADSASGGCAFTIGADVIPPNATPVIDSVSVTSPGGEHRAGEPVHFVAVASDADGDRLRYQWVFGDGGRATGADVQHAYAEAGTYKAKLVVTDGEDKATQRLRVVVKP